MIRPDSAAGLVEQSGEVVKAFEFSSDQWHDFLFSFRRPVLKRHPHQPFRTIPGSGSANRGETRDELTRHGDKAIPPASGRFELDDLAVHAVAVRPGKSTS